MIIAAFNHKGGVGKTTTVVNVGAVLAAAGRSVLVVDLEADLNASIALGIGPSSADPSIAELLLNERRPLDAVRRLPANRNLHLITGSPRMAHMDALLRNVRQPMQRLADVLRPLDSQFDIILIDTPAGFSVVTLSVPLVAGELIVPTRAEYLSLESLAQLLRWYRDLQGNGAATANLAGILLTMVDYRRQATREIVHMVRLHNRRGVFRVEIPQDPRAAEAPSHGMPLVDYTRSRATLAYEQFTRELMKRLSAPRR